MIDGVPGSGFGFSGNIKSGRLSGCDCFFGYVICQVMNVKDISACEDAGCRSFQ